MKKHIKTVIRALCFVMPVAFIELVGWLVSAGKWWGWLLMPLSMSGLFCLMFICEGITELIKWAWRDDK